MLSQGQESWVFTLGQSACFCRAGAADAVCSGTGGDLKEAGVGCRLRHNTAVEKELKPGRTRTGRQRFSNGEWTTEGPASAISRRFDFRFADNPKQKKTNKN